MQSYYYIAQAYTAAKLETEVDRMLAKNDRNQLVGGAFAAPARFTCREWHETDTIYNQAMVLYWDAGKN